MLPEKHRPPDFDSVLGNENLIESLVNNLSDGVITHAILFCGPSGCGKTTFARILASYLECDHPEIVNASRNRGIDFMRKTIDDMYYRPAFGNKASVYIFDEAHGLTLDSSRALLDVTEEPPEHVYLIFCSTDPEKMHDKLRNRCERYDVEPLKGPLMRKLLMRVAEAEKIKLSKEIMNLIVSNSGGSARIAINSLNKVRSITSTEDAAELLAHIDVEAELIPVFKKLLFAGVSGKKVKWSSICTDLKSLLKSYGAEGIRISLFNYLGGCLLRADGSAADRYTEMMSHLDTFPLDSVTGKNHLVFLVRKVFSTK